MEGGYATDQQYGVPVVSQQPMVYPPPPPAPQQVAHTNHTTVVVTQQPTVMRERAWRSGLFGCFDDCGICMLVWCCPCCATTQLLGDMGENMCLPCCVVNWDVAIRVKLRTILGIRGSICDDCFVTSFCGTCAMCQMLREVKIAKHEGLL